MFNEKVDSFLGKLHSQTLPMQKKSFEPGTPKGRVLEKISLNFPGAHGRYAVWPMDSVITDYPFVTLFNTREICIPRKNVSADGVETEFNAWIKILPDGAYQMKDPVTGRISSSLTTEEEQLLHDAGNLFDQLFDEVDARNNLEMTQTIARKRNYTIFNAYCLNKWDFDNPRTPKRSNFSALFVCTAKGFVQAVEDNVNERLAVNGNDPSFVGNIYGRELSGRNGFLMFSISKAKVGAGYAVTASHEVVSGKALESVSVPTEDADLMKDPVQAFLGWQANKDEENPVGSKRLFNANLIKQAIAFMSQQLQAIRSAKSSGTDIKQAIAATNALVLNNSQPTNSQGQPTNDPMLASMAAPVQPGVNSERIAQQNTSPFQTPPASQINPITGAPVNGGGYSYNMGQNSPFNQPGFTRPEDGKGDLPF